MVGQYSVSAYSIRPALFTDRRMRHVRFGPRLFRRLRCEMRQQAHVSVIGFSVIRRSDPTRTAAHRLPFVPPGPFSLLSLPEKNRRLCRHCSFCALRSVRPPSFASSFTSKNSDVRLRTISKRHTGAGASCPGCLCRFEFSELRRSRSAIESGFSGSANPDQYLWQHGRRDCFLRSPVAGSGRVGCDGVYGGVGPLSFLTRKAAAKLAVADRDCPAYYFGVCRPAFDSAGI